MPLPNSTFLLLENLDRKGSEEVVRWSESRKVELGKGPGIEAKARGPSEELTDKRKRGL